MKIFNIGYSLILLWTVALFLGGVQLVLANESSTRGEEVVKLLETYQHLDDQVVTLRQEVSALGSLDRIQKEAQGLGFFINSEALDFIGAPKLAAPLP